MQGEISLRTGAVWKAERAECQKATNNETRHQSRCTSSHWTRSENSDRKCDGANPAHQESSVKTEGERKEGRHYGD